MKASASYQQRQTWAARKAEFRDPFARWLRGAIR